MDDAREQLVTRIEAYAAARASQNLFLQSLAAQALASSLNSIQPIPLSRDQDPENDGENPASPDP